MSSRTPDRATTRTGRQPMPCAASTAASAALAAAFARARRNVARAGHHRQQASRHRRHAISPFSQWACETRRCAPTAGHACVRSGQPPSKASRSRAMLETPLLDFRRAAARRRARSLARLSAYYQKTFRCAMPTLRALRASSAAARKTSARRPT